jgi:hypothetical protein
MDLIRNFFSVVQIHENGEMYEIFKYDIFLYVQIYLGATKEPCHR